MQKLLEERRCKHCLILMKEGTNYLDAYHHIRFCEKNPECKVFWCYTCRVRLKGLITIREHLKSSLHGEKTGNKAPSVRLTRVKDENKVAKENWKKSFSPWATAGAAPNSKDFFRKEGKKYDLIVIDPPWGFDRRWTKSSALHHYPTMKDEEVYALPVGQLAADDCMLLVWSTDTKLDVALKAIDSWGFKYKNKFMVWVKTFSKSKNPVCGLGNYTRGCTESVYLGTRGDIYPLKDGDGGCTESIYLGSKGRITTFRDAKNVSQLLVAPRRGHSEKPEEFWMELKRYLGKNYHELNKIELFSRKRRKGWECWGNEV